MIIVCPNTTVSKYVFDWWPASTWRCPGETV
jgi:hypothetical protein